MRFTMFFLAAVSVAVVFALSDRTSGEPADSERNEATAGEASDRGAVSSAGDTSTSAVRVEAPERPLPRLPEPVETGLPDMGVPDPFVEAGLSQQQVDDFVAEVRGYMELQRELERRLDAEELSAEEYLEQLRAAERAAEQRLEALVGDKRDLLMPALQQYVLAAWTEYRPMLEDPIEEDTVAESGETAALD